METPTKVPPIDEASEEPVIDYDDEWSEDDLRRLTEDCVRRFYEENPMDEDLV